MTKIWFQQNVVISLVFTMARAQGLLRHYVLKGKYENLEDKKLSEDSDPRTSLAHRGNFDEEKSLRTVGVSIVTIENPDGVEATGGAQARPKALAALRFKWKI